MRVRYEDGGVIKSLDLAVSSLKDLAPVLRRFGKHLRAATRQHFEAQGPGWPALAVGTLQRLQQTRTSEVTAHGLLRRSYVKRAGQALLRRKGDAEALVKVADLVRLQQGGGQVNSALGRRLAKKLAKAEEQDTFERREGKRAIEKHAPLGKLASSIRASVEGGTLTVESRVPWAGVHNEGGSAGRGAQIPARPFLYLTPADLEVLAQYVMEQGR